MHKFIAKINDVVTIAIENNKHILDKCNDIYMKNKMINEQISILFIKDISNIIYLYSVSHYSIFTNYIDEKLRKYNCNINEYFDDTKNMKNRYKTSHDFFTISTLFNNYDKELILIILNILIKRYNFDINQYKTQCSMYNRDSLTFLYRPLFFHIISRDELYDKSFLDTLIYTYKYNVNIIITTKAADGTIYMYNILEDIVSGELIPNKISKKWMYDYLVSRGALTIDQINKKLQQI